MMTKIFLTAIREFKATAMTKAFIFGTVLLPAIIGGVLWVAGSAGLFSQTGKATEGTLAIVDPTSGAVGERIRARLKPAPKPTTNADTAPQHADDAPTSTNAASSAAQHAIEQSQSPLHQLPPNVDVEQLAPGDDLDPVRDRVRDGDLLGLLVLDNSSLEPGGNVGLFVGPKAGANDIDILQSGIGEAIVDYRLDNAGVDAKQIRTLVSQPAVKITTLTATGEASGGEKLLEILPYAMLMLLALAIFTGSGYLLMSTVEEKSSRVMEVLLSGLSPGQLMTGKIIGQGMVGLVTLAIYAGLGVFTAKQFSVFQLIPPNLFAWLFIYFIMGYFIFAAFNAAIGAAVNEIREAQALQGPVMGLTILMIYLTIFSTTISHNPHSTLAQILSFFPPATPFVMPVRLGFVNDPMPTWQLYGAPIVGFAGMFFSMWAAAKIFRVGVLMYGQPPSLKVMVKWLQYK